jgi:hypothetical protein
VEVKKEENKQLALTDDAAADYELARQTLMALMQEGIKAVEDARSVASSNENPMSFQAVATLIKAVGDTTKELFDIHRKTKQLKEIPQDPNKKILDDGNVNIDKAVFVGTTSDLMDKIKAKHK